MDIESIVKRIEAEPFFPEGDGPRHGNATAFRSYKQRVLEILKQPNPGHAGTCFGALRLCDCGNTCCP